MRVFAALPLPEQALDALQSARTLLGSRYPRLRMAGAAGIHLTLHFFGELEPHKVDELKGIWEDPELARRVIPVSFGPLGQFPQRGSPRVIWVGIDKGAKELEAYSDLFQSKIARLGYREDPRGFSAHLTLARSGGERLAEGWDRDIPIARVEFAFRECVLFQSILSPGGSRYVPLARAAFKEAGDAPR